MLSHRKATKPQKISCQISQVGKVTTCHVLLTNVNVNGNVYKGKLMTCLASGNFCKCYLTFAIATQERFDISG